MKSNHRGGWAAWSIAALLMAPVAGSLPGGPAVERPCTKDTECVSIVETVCRRDTHTLRVEATSSNPNATLMVLNADTEREIGALHTKGEGRHEGEFDVAACPGSITVKSSTGGAATAAVTLE